MSKRVALSGFKKMSDKELIIVATSAVQGMTNNPYFADPVPSSTVLDEKVQEFIKVASVGQRGSSFEIGLKNFVKGELIDLLKQMAFYVNSNSDGNVHMLLSSALPLSAPRVLGKVPGIPVLLKLSDGALKGQFRFDFQKVENAMLYEYMVSKDFDENGEIDWGDVRFTTASSLRNIIYGVVIAETYYVKVRALNAHGVGDWSNEVSLTCR